MGAFLKLACARSKPLECAWLQKGDLRLLGQCDDESDSLD